MKNGVCLKHEWSEMEYDPLGSIKTTRICVNCNKGETEMWDFSTGSYKWIDGTFSPIDDDVFIVAADENDYASAMAELRVMLEKRFMPLIRSSDFEPMVGKRRVYYVFAKRWMESEILYDPRMRKLLILNHI